MPPPTARMRAQAGSRRTDPSPNPSPSPSPGPGPSPNPNATAGGLAKKTLLSYEEWIRFVKVCRLIDPNPKP